VCGGFQQLATADLWTGYLASSPPESKTAEIKAVRADLEDLLRKLHELRIGKSQLDVIRAYTTSVALIVCWGH
jgi:hypothetical protein